MDEPSRSSPRPRPTPPADEAPPVPRGGAWARLRDRVANRQRTGLSRRQSWVVGAASLFVVGAAIVAAVVVLRPADGTAAGPTTVNDSAELTNQAQADAFVAGATSAVAAVTSYDYRDLDGAMSTGLAVTTGTYRNSYRASLQGALGDAARRDKLVQSFAVDRAGIGAVTANGRQARVLVFGVQTVTVDDGKGGVRATPLTLTATVVRSGTTYQISGLVVDANAGLPPGTAGLSDAAEAAREQVDNLLSYRRATFDADLERAQRYAVDPLASMLTAKAAATRSALLKGSYDLAGAVTAVAVERASGDTVVLLVAASGTKVTDSGARSELIDGRYEVTVVFFDGRWRTSIVDPVASA
ncbi:MAG: hypothetical protein ABI345_04305 [Jatrophihabitans sp.]